MAFQSILPRAMRGPGTFSTVDVVGPIFVPTTMTSITITGDMAQTELDNPDLTLECKFYKSSDSGATWQPETRYTWRGGEATVDRPTGTPLPPQPPSVHWEGEALESIKGKHVKADVILTQAFAVGLLGEFI